MCGTGLLHLLWRCSLISVMLLIKGVPCHFSLLSCFFSFNLCVCVCVCVHIHMFCSFFLVQFLFVDFFQQPEVSLNSCKFATCSCMNETESS